MKSYFTIIIIVVLLISYVFFINKVSEVYYTYDFSEDNTTNLLGEDDVGTDVDVGVSGSVAVSVKRPRWYGTIYEVYNGKKNLNTLYLFNLIKLNINFNSHSLIWIHFLYLFVLIVLYFIIDIKSLNKGEKNDGENKKFISNR